nr:MAG TPA: hypothetical protein [Bacteriophage sp.]
MQCGAGKYLLNNNQLNVNTDAATSLKLITINY